MTNLKCVRLNWGIPGWRRFMVLIVVMLENGPPSPRPPHPFKISLITKLSGSIIHYVQQHYTINIQKPLLIGRTIVVSSKRKENKNAHEKTANVSRARCSSFFFRFFFFFFTLKCSESSVIFSLSVENPTEQVALLCVCMYIKTTHDKSVCWASSSRRRRKYPESSAGGEFRLVKC